MELKKDIIAIIILAVAVAAGVGLLISRITMLGDSDYNQKQIELYQRDIEELNVNLTKNNATIQTRQQQVSNLATNITSTTQQISSLTLQLATAQSEYTTASGQVTTHLIIEGVVGGVTVLTNIGTAIFDYYERSLQTTLKEVNAAITSFIEIMTPKVFSSETTFMDVTIYNASIGKFYNLTLLYNASKDGFSLSTMKSKVCDKMGILILVTSDMNFTFGVSLYNNWNCSNATIMDTGAVAFSTENLGYASVRLNNPALQNRDDYLLYLGNGDITVTENAEGTLDPDNAFDIISPFTSARFYNPTNTFTAKNVLIYSQALI